MSVPVKVRVLFTVNVFPSAIVNVADVVGAVIANLLILVAVATPKTGVIKVGLLANTRDPDPVSSDIIEASSELLVVANTFSLSAL